MLLYDKVQFFHFQWQKFWSVLSKMDLCSSKAHLVFSLRLSHEALSALEIPNDLLQVIQDLLQDLRVHCLLTTLQHTEEGLFTEFLRMSCVHFRQTMSNEISEKKSLIKMTCRKGYWSTLIISRWTG